MLTLTLSLTHCHSHTTHIAHTHDRHGLGFWAVMGIAQTSLFTAFSDPSAEAAQLIGLLCDFFSICYYAAPLSSMAEVVRKRDASSLYLPAILVNCVNASLWMLYGIFSVGSVILYGPSMLGLLLSLVQVVLVFVYHEGKWFDAVSGFITHRTIHVKTRVWDETSSLSVCPSASPSAGCLSGSPYPSPRLPRTPTLKAFSRDREASILATPGARRMTFVIAPSDIEQPLLWES